MIRNYDTCVNLIFTLNRIFDITFQPTTARVEAYIFFNESEQKVWYNNIRISRRDLKHKNNKGVIT